MVLKIIGLVIATVALYVTGVVAFIDIFTEATVFNSPVLWTFIGIIGGAIANILIIVTFARSGLRALRSRKTHRQMRETMDSMMDGFDLD